MIKSNVKVTVHCIFLAVPSYKYAIDTLVPVLGYVTAGCAVRANCRHIIGMSDAFNVCYIYIYINLHRHIYGIFYLMGGRMWRGAIGQKSALLLLYIFIVIYIHL